MIKKACFAKIFVAAALAAGISASALASTMHVKTNTGWEVSSDGGATFVAATDTGDYAFSNGQTADYLWSSSSPGGNEHRFFRFSFNIPGTPTAASFYSLQDDDITSFKINTNLVYEDVDGVSTLVDPSIDIFSAAGLTSGTNTILIDFQNTYCCGAGLAMDLVIEFDGGGSVPEPGSLALLGLSLFGIVASRKRG